MIKNSTQNWMTGETVKVGFMTLVVIAAIATPGDYKLDAYVLESGRGEFYWFVPHNGLSKLYSDNAVDAINEVREAV